MPIMTTSTVRLTPHPESLASRWQMARGRLPRTAMMPSAWQHPDTVYDMRDDAACDMVLRPGNAGSWLGWFHRRGWLRRYCLGRPLMRLLLQPCIDQCDERMRQICELRKLGRRLYE